MAKKNKSQLRECGNCVFSNPILSPTFKGEDIECRRLPPTQDASMHRTDPHPHPVVRTDGWCGEYKPQYQPKPEKEDGKDKEGTTKD